jgi:hypothetical protein
MQSRCAFLQEAAEVLHTRLKDGKEGYSFDLATGRAGRKRSTGL